MMSDKSDMHKYCEGSAFKFGEILSFYHQILRSVFQDKTGEIYLQKDPETSYLKGLILP